MHNLRITISNKNFLLKIVLFLVLVLFGVFSYLDNSNIIDLIYLFATIVLFIRFIAIKLYQ